MISSFPEFKNLTLDDKEDIENYVKEFPPYSDFNFTSMHIWNIKEDAQIATLNGNLVVQFNDYITGDPFFSFLGYNNIKDTILKLIDYARYASISPVIKLVPEEVALKTPTSTFKIQEDRDNFDYVYSLKELHGYEGSKYQQSRYRARRFLKENPEVVVAPLNLADAEVERSVYSLIYIWEKNKLEKNQFVELKHEEMALKRLFGNVVNSNSNIRAIGIFHKDSLVSFSIFEILSDLYAISHFHKADNNYLGIYDFLMQEKAKHLHMLGVEYFNYEQDLGLANLRRSKSSYRPSHFLKKYKVSLVV